MLSWCIKGTVCILKLTYPEMRLSCVVSFVSVYAVILSLCSCNTPPTYILNLDEAPELRWKQVGKDYGSQIVKARSQVIHLFKIPKAILELMETQSTAIEAYLPPEYAAEIVGLANTVGVSVTDMIFVNILYDITAACTSIVAQTSNNTIIHARNLDYALAAELRNLTIIIDVRRNNKTVYTGITYAGMVGIATGQKPNAFTISLNQRNKGFRIENLYQILLDRESRFVTFEIRSVLESAIGNFRSTVLHFLTIPLMAPCYIILGGVQPDEGAVITRAREAELSIRFIDTKKDVWYVLETNYDWWDPPPSRDNRRDPAVKHMNQIGQSKVSLDTLYDVLSTPPVCSSRNTTYTALMSAASPDALRAVIRDKDAPCKTGQ